ncbi:MULTISPECIES: chemotaxis protein CheW [unclassified Janthinobacterium]|uniref:chemotaxis protein CheW n=1 Tax=unclassified Janthinobacterium TaxID=2610881 RepID=UPI0008F51CAD|nr:MULTISPECIES: chemotaxis protein CheW [unclassified Janthinobacterium]APA67715.1 chemotaxis protein CheW [Janthinobacterium sp. 1_2014MBL_MicDiv]MDN2709240.1 chemotaxis protein CheW [Janthinobacterium sp. SUN118]
MQPTTTAGAAGAAERSTVQYLSFRLGGLEYGLDYRCVRELRPLKELDRFSSEGEVLQSVAVSRGVIIPIVDMRAAFGSMQGTPDPATDVIILQLSNGVMGMVVDGVTDIVSLAPGDIAPVPGLGDTEADYLLGVGKVAGRRLILVDIDRLMAIRSASPMQVA